MHQWVRALEKLRTSRDISKNQLEERGIMTRSQYNTMLKAKKGPRFDNLDRLLRGFGVTWKEWAEVYEREPAVAKAAQAIRPKQKRGHRKLSVG